MHLAVAPAAERPADELEADAARALHEDEVVSRQQAWGDRGRLGGVFDRVNLSLVAVSHRFCERAPQ